MFGMIGLLALLAVVWCAAITACLAYNAAAWGYVLAKCWLWLAVPVFGMVALTFTQALAVGMLISVVGAKTYMPPNELFDLTSDDDLDEDKKAAKKKLGWFKAGYFVVVPWMTLAIVWIVKVLFI